MTKILTALLLAATAVTSAQAAQKVPSFVGTWCQILSVKNGHGTPSDHFYGRKADCPENDVVVFDRHSLDGLDYDFDSEEGIDWLYVYGNPKPARGKR
jgi:hypothetical protein